jgi:N-acetylmuramoyl-L-alanine amidase
MTCAVWSTATFAGGVGVVTGFTVVSGNALGPPEAAPAGVDPSPIVWTFCFLLQAAKASAKSTGAATSLSRINVRNAFKSGHAKNKRFLRRRNPLSRFAPKICQRDSNRLSVAMPSSRWGKSVALCVLFLAGCKTVPPQAQLKNTSHTFTSVVVDAGHGGRDSGAYRRSGPPEKVVTLDVATRLSRKLRDSQFNVVMTRTSDVFIPLDTRVDIENSTPNSIFVSIHFNDSRRRGVKGFETYYHSLYAAELAQNIQNRLCSLNGAVNRGVHTADFRVVRKALYPAVLVECGFLSNRSEGREARNGEYRELLADKIAQAIVEQRYGVGAYRAPAAAVVNQEPQPAQQKRKPVLAPPGEGPGLAPPTLSGHGP